MIRALTYTALFVLLTACGDGDSLHPRGGGMAAGDFGSRTVSLNDIVWKHRVGASIVKTPALHRDTLYVVSSDGRLHAISASDGLPQWEAELPSPSHASPAVAGERVLVGHDEGIAAFGFDGSLQWNVGTGSPVEATPVFLGGFAFVGTRDGTIWALESHGGAVAWKATSAGAVEASCALVTGGLVCGGADGYVWHLQAATGELRWSWSPAAPVRAVASDGERAFVVAGTKLVALSLDDAKVAWQFDAGEPFETTAAVRDGVVLVATRDEALAFSATNGSVRWRKALESPARGTISASGDAFYVPVTHAGVVALSTSGEESWRFRADGAVTAAPLPAKSRLFIVDRAGAIHAIE